MAEDITWNGDLATKKTTVLSGGIDYNNTSSYQTWLYDIAQSRFFTVVIQDFISLISPTSDDESQKSDMSGTYFLPVKSIDIALSRVDSMSVPVFFFGDFPILNKKRVRYLPFLFARIIHGIISAVMSIILCLLMDGLF